MKDLRYCSINMFYLILIRITFSFIVASLISYRGLKKKRLSISGALSAWFVGFITGLSGFRFFSCLIIFYFSSSKLTKFGYKIKYKVQDEYEIGEGNRNYLQVLCSSLSAVIASLFYITNFGFADHLVKFYDPFNPNSNLASTITCFIVGFYGACNGDTWASELGILSKQKPRYIFNPWSTVPAGTNGGVTLLGNIGSIMGGTLIGLVAYIAGSFTISSYFVSCR